MDERDEVHDELLGRVVGELRTLPRVAEADVRRVVAAATAAGRDEEEDDDAIATPARRSWRGVPLAWAAGIAFLAGAAGFFTGRRGGEVASVPAAVAPAPGVTPVGLTPAGDAASRETAARVTQFVLDAPDAARVALVGDFNGWDAATTPLVRDPVSGLWTATIAVAPGRHVYAFMVNDSVLTLDPRAATVRDPDLGTTASVMLVGAR